MSRLSYHQNVFDLLEIEPKTSPVALQSLDKCAKRIDWMPQAIRDWYSLEGFVPHKRNTNSEGNLWWDYSSPGDEIVCLTEVLEGIASVWPLEEYEEGLLEGMVKIVEEMESGTEFYIMPLWNDPPVFSFTDDNGIPMRVKASWGPVKWKRCDNPPEFSEFVFEWIAEKYRLPHTPQSFDEDLDPLFPIRYSLTKPKPKRYLKGLWVRSPRAPALQPPHLDYLIEHLGDPESARTNGVICYRFSAPTGEIKITTDSWEVKDGCSAWWLSAKDRKSLEELACHIQWMGILLRSSSNVGKAVLKRVRSSAS